MMVAPALQKFAVGDTVKVDSPGNWFDGRSGEIIQENSTSEFFTLFNIEFPEKLDRHYSSRRVSVGIGFKPWELRQVEGQ